MGTAHGRSRVQRMRLAIARAPRMVATRLAVTTILAACASAASEHTL